MKVYRVNWHRAKARYSRWMEEVVIVRNEMEWTVSWFENEQHKWEGRLHIAQEEGRSGHACYGKKQALMWEEMKQEAKNAFDKCIENT
jgi:hypothetical protein